MGRRIPCLFVILSEMLVFIAEEDGKPSSFTFPIGIGTDFIKDIQNPDYLLNARSVFDEVCTYFHASMCSSVIV